jgi:hypothetical protein
VTYGFPSSFIVVSPTAKGSCFAPRLWTVPVGASQEITRRSWAQSYLQGYTRRYRMPAHIAANLRRLAPGFVLLGAFPLAVLLSGAACGSPTPSTRPVGAFLLGSSYSCTGLDGGGGAVEIDASGGDGGSPTCVVGQSYCNAFFSSVPPATIPSLSCVSLTGALAACADNPTCACICPQGAQALQTCLLNCFCSDEGGRATVACFQN